MEAELIDGIYKKIGLLGSGAFGKVYLCEKVGERANKFILNRIRKNQPERIGRYFALKKFYRPSDDQNGLDYTTLRDIKFLSSLQHPHVLKSHEIICVRKENGHFSLYMVLEFMLDVHRALSQVPQLNEQKNIKILGSHILHGLDFLHSKFIFHRDLKPENIFISKDGIAKIGDFGMSREYGTPGIHYSKRVCTAEYRAPEIFFDTSFYTEKSDIWAFGCTFAAFLTRKNLFCRQQEQDMDLVVLQKIFYLLGTPNEQVWPGYSKFPKFIQFEQCQPKNLQKQLGISSQAASILKICLSLDPRKRPSARQLLQQPFFSTVRGQRIPIGFYYEQELESRIKNSRMQYE